MSLFVNFNQWINSDLRAQLSDDIDKIYAPDDVLQDVQAIMRHCEHSKPYYQVNNLFFLNEFGLDAFQFSIKSQPFEEYVRVIKNGLNRYALYTRYVEGNVRMNAYLDLLQTLRYTATILQNEAKWHERPIGVNEIIRRRNNGSLL